MAEIKNYTLNFGFGRAARLTCLRQVSLRRNSTCQWLDQALATNCMGCRHG